MKADFINDIDFSTDFGLETLMSELYDNRLFTAKDLNISSRVISYWKETKVLTWFPPHKTARFNFMEAAWLGVLKFLQRAGLSIELMRKITAELIDEPIAKNLATELIQAELRKLSEKGEDDSLRAIRLRECLNSKSDMDKLHREMNYFTGLVQYAIKTKMPCGIIINQDKEIRTFFGDTFNQKDNLVHLISEFNIIIPMKPILTDLIMIEFNRNNYDFPVLSTDEKIVIKEIRRNDVENIEIKKNKERISLKITKGKELDNRELAEMLMNGDLNGWKGINITSRNEGSWYIKKSKTIIE